MQAYSQSRVVKSLLKQFLIFSGRATGSLRISPTFLIVGGQKCGTTSLHNYLLQHPDVSRTLKKEIHFFDIDYQKGINFYRGHFPSIFYHFIFKTLKGCNPVAGDSTPYYSFHPLVPERVAKNFPDIKIIFLLRNPADRAYSHYHHEVRIGVETISFNDAIVKEEERLAGEEEKLYADPRYNSIPHQHFSYLARGRYIEQIKEWRLFFDSEQILNPSQTFKVVEQFLGLKHSEINMFKKYNKFGYSKMEPSTRKVLVEYFEPYNHALYSYLGRDFNWQ